MHHYRVMDVTQSASRGRWRARIGDTLMAKVAGADFDEVRRQIHLTPGPRWFAAGSPICQVHGDASMFVGGIRALLLQSLHPSAMAAIAAIGSTSAKAGDPWGRLQRVSAFIATTTFGCADDAQAAIDRARQTHDAIRGTTAKGVRFAASDPDLLRWVYVAEADSFLRAHQEFGATPLSAVDADIYVAQTAVLGYALGATDLPSTVAGLQQAIVGYRPLMQVGPDTAAAADYLMHHPPFPVAARPGYRWLVDGAMATLPPWALEMLGEPVPSTLRARMNMAAGRWATRVVRAVMPPAPQRDEPEDPVQPPRPRA